MATKKCRHCQVRYERKPEHHSFRNWCSIDCGVALSIAKLAASKDKAKKVKHKEDKERVKPLSKWLDEAQAVVNRYVRLRDKDLGCVSCDKPASWDGQWHASHFHSRGKSSFLRFNLLNIHKSCSVCNNHESGNLIPYKAEMINRIGQERFDHLEATASNPRRYDMAYLARLKKIFAKRCRILERRS